MQLQKMEDEQQKILLNASIRWQEEERQRIAADLHDDAGPLTRHSSFIPERKPGTPGHQYTASKYL
jgi:hypothetical protein